MSTQDSLIAFYRNVLSTVRYVADESGVISKVMPGSTDRFPVAVSGKSLVLPTKVQLDHPDWSNRIAFHPMREDFTSGQSPVFEDYRSAMNYTLQVHTCFLFLSIADMALKDKDYQKSLPRDVADYLRAVKDGDAKFKKVLVDLLEADPSKYRNEMSFIRINVQKSRKVDGQVRKRVATVVFPVLEKILSHSKTNKVDEVAGVGLRGVDRAMIIALYKLLFPLCETPGAYDTYSDSLQAPSMDALLRCSMALIERNNEVVTPMIGHAPGMEEIIIPYNWRDIALNIDANAPMFNSVPMLEGNVSKGHVVRNAAALDAISVPDASVSAQYAQAAVQDPARNVGVVPPPTPQLDLGIATTHQTAQPTSPIVMQQPQQVQTAQQPVSFKLDAPRTAQPAIAHPGNVVEQPQHQKYNNITTPQQISNAGTPLFGQQNQQQQPQGLPGMPAGNPTVVQTTMGPAYMYPDGTVYTQAQMAQAMAAAQIEQAKKQQQQVQQLAANPAMMELMALNPMSVMQTMQPMMPGMPMGANGMPMGMNGYGMPMVQNPMANRMAGTSYVPLGAVQQVQQPGMVQMPGVMPMQQMPGMVQMPGVMPGMMPGVMPGMMPGVMPGMVQMLQQVIPGMVNGGGAVPMGGVMRPSIPGF